MIHPMHHAATRQRPKLARTRRILQALVVLLAWAVVSLATAQPSCEVLLDDLATAFDAAITYEIGVALEQGDNELAYERQRIERGPDGTITTSTLERRGLRRPDGAGNDEPDGGFGDLGLTCDLEHEVRVFPEGRARLDVTPSDPDAGVTSWSIEFATVDGRRVPTGLVGTFETRVLFVPVRGRFVTSFDAWTF